MPPHISITDFERKIVYARLGDRLRIAGMADVTGRRADIDPARVATLRAESAAAFPDAGNFDEATVWCVLRPATPHSTPIIGSTRYENLWLNLGQGALGFTLALASGRSVADLIARRRPAVPLDGYMTGFTINAVILITSGLLGLLLLWPNTERARLMGETPQPKFA